LKYWETIADKLSAAGFTYGYCSAVTRDGWRWVVDAHRGAFLELKAMLFNFPKAAEEKNAKNLLVIRDVKSAALFEGN
jgi:hypothetical protein